jgi:hypothetical protein
MEAITSRIRFKIWIVWPLPSNVPDVVIANGKNRRGIAENNQMFTSLQCFEMSTEGDRKNRRWTGCGGTADGCRQS